MFRHARRKWRSQHDKAESGSDWTNLRCCIPLDRATVKDFTDYHGYATLVGLDVDVSDKHVDWDPEQVAAGDYSVTPHKKSALSSISDTTTSRSRDNSPSRAPRTPHKEPTVYLDSSFPKLPTRDEASGLEPSDTYDFNIILLNETAWFCEALRSAAIAAQDRQYKQGVIRPKMSLTVAGFDALAGDDEGEGDASVQHQESVDSEGMVGDIQKAGKITMAAKIFGLREEEGIWSEFRILAHMLTFSETLLPLCGSAVSRSPHSDPSVPMFLA